MINQIPLIGQARNPRALLKLNDNIIRKLDHIEYVENNVSQPDSFHARMPLYNLSDVVDIEYWMSQPAILAEVLMGFPNDPSNYGPQDLDSMIIGAVNNINLHVFENGSGMVDIDGFDLSKKFIDNQTVEKYPNNTSSQIATILANKEGLTPIVTATTEPAGYYYQQDFIQLGAAMTEWDLLTFLAQKEGFQVFVRGQSLYFQPQQTQTQNPWLLQVQTPEGGNTAVMNGTSLTVSRNLNYAKDVIVTVISMNSASGRVSETVRVRKTKNAVVASAAQIVGQAQTFTYRIPGLSKQQALARAQQLAQNITIHEKVIKFDTPGDSVLHKDSLIQVQGVSPSTDQIYYPDTITRSISNGNYNMQVVCKNHSTQNVTNA